MAVVDLSPTEIADAMASGTIVLIDVRETQEYAAERIDGARLFPLSNFDPRALPAGDGRTIVFHCGSGMRSAKAVMQCQAAGVAVDGHLAGGIQAWKAAGLPVLRLDASTGQMREIR